MQEGSRVQSHKNSCFIGCSTYVEAAVEACSHVISVPGRARKQNEMWRLVGGRLTPLSRAWLAGASPIHMHQGRQAGLGVASAWPGRSLNSAARPRGRSRRKEVLFGLENDPALHGFPFRPGRLVPKTRAARAIRHELCRSRLTESCAFKRCHIDTTSVVNDGGKGSMNSCSYGRRDEASTSASPIRKCEVEAFPRKWCTWDSRAAGGP